MEQLLKAQHVSKNYGDLKVLIDVNITLKIGEIITIIGPSGAGKTTLMRIINQITAPDSGSVIFDGERLQEKHISLIGYLPEERGLYKKMKVGEQVQRLTAPQNAGLYYLQVTNENQEVKSLKIIIH